MIPAEARWVIQNIYLPTTNCSSFSQLGVKDCLSCYIYIYIHTYLFFFFFLNIVLAFSLSSSRRDTPCSAPPKFLSHNHFFCCCFPRAEAKSSYLIIVRFYFAVRKLQEVIIAFALVRRKMRCIKQKKEERVREPR